MACSFLRRHLQGSRAYLDELRPDSTRLPLPPFLADHAGPSRSRSSSRPRSSTFDKVDAQDGPVSTRRWALGTRSKLLGRAAWLGLALLVVLGFYLSFDPRAVDRIEYTGSCAACLALLGPMKQLAEMGDEGFVDLATGFCSRLGVRRRLAFAVWTGRTSSKS